MWAWRENGITTARTKGRYKLAHSSWDTNPHSDWHTGPGLVEDVQKAIEMPENVRLKT